MGKLFTDAKKTSTKRIDTDPKRSGTQPQTRILEAPRKSANRATELELCQESG
jgi:hypothetical protein